MTSQLLTVVFPSNFCYRFFIFNPHVFTYLSISNSAFSGYSNAFRTEMNVKKLLQHYRKRWIIWIFEKLTSTLPLLCQFLWGKSSHVKCNISMYCTTSILYICYVVLILLAGLAVCISFHHLMLNSFKIATAIR